MINYERTRVFITVKTYPHPSAKHDELVCTAGITESGEWVRLYPVRYRYEAIEKQYEKYQWIEVDLAPRGTKDKRKESRQPDMSSIVLGEKISTANRWLERRKIVDKLPIYTRKQLEILYDTDLTSLGVVQPTKIHDLIIVPTDETWSDSQEACLKQLHLFDEKKPLIKIPFSFKYVFECADSTEPHTATITDWEVGILWLKMFEKYGNEKDAANKVKDKFLTSICKPDNEVRFFMGTIHPRNQWIILGVYYPPRCFQPSLI